jgi:uncharacterized protein YjiS (DUF1127 family)
MRIPAYIHLPTALPAPRRPGRLARLLAAAGALLRHWRAERRTAAVLDSLDPATLRDIGMTRAEMHRQMEAERQALLRRVRQAGL